MIRGADGDRIDVFADFVKHLAEVMERLCIFKVFVLLAFAESVLIDIANRDDLSIVCGIF